MKLQSKNHESCTVGVNFCIVHLGPAAGKLKYTLLDKRDISLFQEFQFENDYEEADIENSGSDSSVCNLIEGNSSSDASVKEIPEPFVEIDKNGEGAVLYAYAYPVSRGRHTGKYVHELLWEKHCGGIAPGFKVFHKNGITVDNRLENLSLCPVGVNILPDINQKTFENSLYWSAIEGMPHEMEPIYIKLFSIQEEVSLMKDRFFECHYPPCIRMEKRPQEFSICGLCHVTRYCGLVCQAKDWPLHKAICALRPHPTFEENFVDR